MAATVHVQWQHCKWCCRSFCAYVANGVEGSVYRSMRQDQDEAVKFEINAVDGSKPFPFEIQFAALHRRHLQVSPPGQQQGDLISVVERWLRGLLLLSLAIIQSAAPSPKRPKAGHENPCRTRTTTVPFVVIQRKKAKVNNGKTIQKHL